MNSRPCRKYVRVWCRSSGSTTPHGVPSRARLQSCRRRQYGHWFWTWWPLWGLKAAWIVLCRVPSRTRNGTTGYLSALYGVPESYHVRCREGASYCMVCAPAIVRAWRRDCDLEYHSGTCTGKSRARAARVGGGEWKRCAVVPGRGGGGWCCLAVSAWCVVLCRVHTRLHDRLPAAFRPRAGVSRHRRKRQHNKPASLAEALATWLQLRMFVLYVDMPRK